MSDNGVETPDIKLASWQRRDEDEDHDESQSDVGFDEHAYLAGNVTVVQQPDNVNRGKSGPHNFIHIIIGRAKFAADNNYYVVSIIVCFCKTRDCVKRKIG